MKHFAFVLSLVITNLVFGTQNKYALLIGINKYQIKDSTGKTVLDPKNQLRGCVNDAESMKGLLINKFNFLPSNITSLYDTIATRATIFKQIDALLKKCKSGDVAVVYYAGHGMPFRYGNGSSDVAEVILPANSFVTIPFSCIQQSELANKFNLFVDKNITLTTIFDCCFSLATGKNGPLMVPESLPFPDSVKIDIGKTNADSGWAEPVEEEDADEFSLLPKDMDTLSVSSVNTISTNRGLSSEKYLQMTRNVMPYGFDTVYTSFNPPSQRENSPFIFLSATNDMQMAPEITDEYGVRHGGFTSALLKVFETNSALISFRDAFMEIVKKTKSAGEDITPSARYKPNVREEKNLFGITDGLKLKVYLPSENYTFNDLNAVYKKWIKPLSDSVYKIQSFTRSNSRCSKVYILNNGKSVLYIDAASQKNIVISNVELLKKYLRNRPYIIYMPVPKVVSDSIRKQCLKNKNIELVSDMSKAEVSLYCTNYSSAKNGLIGKALDVGKNLTDNIINYDYKENLSFVGSNETVGTWRNKTVHAFDANENLVVPANTIPGKIVTKFVRWLDKKTGK